jgi:hypothetical protein
MRQDVNNEEGLKRYLDSEEREITIVDEGSRNLKSLRDINAMNINEDPLFNNSVDDMVEFKNPTQQSIEQRNDFTLGKDR